MLSRAGSFTCVLGEAKGVVPAVTDGDDVAIASGPNTTWPKTWSMRKRPALRRSRSPPLLLTAVVNDPDWEPPPLVVCACPVPHRVAARTTAKVTKGRWSKRCRVVMPHLHIELMGTDGSRGLRFGKNVPKTSEGGTSGNGSSALICVSSKKAVKTR